MSDSTLAKFQAEAAKDESLQVLSQVIRAGWPTKTSMVPTSAQPFFKYRDEMTLQNGLVFKGTKIVVPESLHRCMLEETHKSPQGLQACLRRAREVFFWPRMFAQLKDLIHKCSICQSVKPEQANEPFQPHPVPDRPWQRVATDLFTFENRNFLVLVDYYSNFIELDYLADTSSQTVIHKLKMHFARHGVPDYVASDNGPQYTSSEFRRFATTWKFNHVSTSPHYRQANGMAESAVKTCKTIMKKALLSKSDLYLGLLDHHNTPTAATGISPCQRLFGRRTKTLLPFSESLLKTDQTVSDLLKKIVSSKQSISTSILNNSQNSGQVTWCARNCLVKHSSHKQLFLLKSHPAATWLKSMADSIGVIVSSCVLPRNHLKNLPPKWTKMT